MLPAHGTQCPSALCRLLLIKKSRFAHASSLCQVASAEHCLSALGRSILAGAEALQGWM